jgi:hypothetical protein
MFQVQNITNDSRQKQTLVLPDGTQIVLSIYFVPMQYGWFITQVSYANTSFVLNGVRICNSPNLLYQYRNKIPFGLAVLSPSGREPTQQDDLTSGATLLYILTEEEVDEYTEYLSG